MLIEFFGENFGCFREEFRLSMLATDIDPDSKRGTIDVSIKGDPEPLKLLRSAAIYGPNASGKSTVLRAASALRGAIAGSRRLRSDDTLAYYEPFALGLSAKKPSRLGMKAIIDGHVYDYEIKFDRKAFTFEHLERWVGGSRVTLFKRSGQDVEGMWKDQESFKLLAKDFGPNKLLLSLADRLMPSLARGIAPGFRRLLGSFDGASPAWYFERSNAVAKRVREEPLFASWLLSHLKAADLGVSEVRTEEVKVVVHVEADTEEDEGGGSEGITERIETDYRLSLIHTFGSESGPIAFHRESLGTRRLVDIAPLLFDLAHDQRPRAAFADELDASLHPTVFKGLINHFNCQMPHQDARGQLIFVTHETLLMDAEAKFAPLRRDQLYLTEKASDGSARLYSVAEFRERNNLNLRKRYLEGRYGAIPAVGRFPE